MSRTIQSLVCALAISLGAGSLAAAEPARATSDTPRAELQTGEKRLQRRHQRTHDRRHYRDRRADWRHRHGHRDRSYRHRNYASDRHYRGPRCWVERRHSRYHGRPAVISLRICRDRYGRQYVDRGSERLVYYVAPRHRRYR